MSENESSEREFFRSPRFHERHLFMLPAYQRQGLQRRIGFAPLHHALFLDATHALFHTNVSTFLVNPQSNSILWEIDCPAYDFACYWQRRILVLVWEQRSFLLWDMNTGHLLHHFSYRRDDDTATLFYNGFILSPDGTLLAAAMGGRQEPFIAVWNLVQQQLVATFPLPTPTYDLDLATLAFHPTGRFLACAHRGHMYLWRLQDNLLLHTWSWNRCGTPTYSCAFSADGRRLFGSCGREGIYMWEIEQEQQRLFVPMLHRQSTDRLETFTVAGKDFLAYTVHRGTTRHEDETLIVESESGKFLHSIPGHFLPPALSPDTTVFTTFDAQGQAHFWDTTTWQEQWSFSLLPGASTPLALHTQTAQAACWSDKRDALLIWDLNTGGLRAQHVFSHGGGSALAYTSDAALLALANNVRLRLYDVRCQQVLPIEAKHTRPILCLACHPHKVLFASGSADACIYLWEGTSLQFRRQYEGHTAGVKCLAFSTNGSMILSGSLDQTLRLWQTETGEEITCLRAHEAPITSIAVHPTLPLWASGDENGMIVVWNSEQRKPIHSLLAHSMKVGSLAFSIDGTLLASGSADETVQLWKVNSREEGATLYPYQHQVGMVAFLADAQTLMTVGASCIRFWQIATLLKHSSTQENR